METRKGLHRQHMGLKHTDEEPIYFGEYDPTALNQIISQQRNMWEHQQKKIITHYIEY